MRMGWGSGGRGLGWGLLLAAATVLPARADAPSPPGEARVNYTFRVAGEIPAALRLVAYPAYFDGSGTPELRTGKSYALVQGHWPTLYAVPAAKMGDIPRDHAATQTWFAENARVCLDKVPRVYAMRDGFDIRDVRDDLQIEVMTEAACKVSPASTTYELRAGTKLRGIFQNGARVLPEELRGALLDEVQVEKPAATAPSPGPGTEPGRGGSRFGCGCSVPTRSESSASIGAALGATAVAIALRRRRRSRA